MYLAVPVVLYACERLLRVFRSGYKTVKILKVKYSTITDLIFCYLIFCFQKIVCVCLYVD